MPVYFRRVQENHFWKSDRILNIFTFAKSQKIHALEVMCPFQFRVCLSQRRGKKWNSLPRYMPFAIARTRQPTEGARPLIARSNTH